jgi:multimeric flavodoxin WrbA
MNQVYRDLVLWADVVLLATPIRWGNASSLYYKMAERLNCVQNQIALHNRVLIQKKVAAFIVTGGQDNIQQVAGQLNTFFTELGFTLPPFNFAGWSRGWTAEDMENNVAEFKQSQHLAQTVKELVNRSVLLSRQIKGIDCAEIKAPKPQVGDSPAHD